MGLAGPPPTDWAVRIENDGEKFFGFDVRTWGGGNGWESDNMLPCKGAHTHTCILYMLQPVLEHTRRNIWVLNLRPSWKGLGSQIANAVLCILRVARYCCYWTCRSFHVSWKVEGGWDGRRETVTFNGLDCYTCLKYVTLTGTCART